MVVDTIGAENTIRIEGSEQEFILPLLPLKNVVMLPKSIIPIIVGRPSSIQAVETALKHDKEIFITAQKEADTENPSYDDVFTYGTRSTILQVMRMPTGSVKILAEGISRARIVGTHPGGNHLQVYYEDVPTTGIEETPELNAAWRHLQKLYANYVKTHDKAPADLMDSGKGPHDIECVADTLAVHVNLSFHERQNILETPNLIDRLFRLATLLQKEIEIAHIEQRIQGRVQSQVEKNQREYYLSEQIKAIHKELGRDDIQNEIETIRAKTRKMKLTAEARDKIDKELRRLEQMPPLSSEAVVSRHYVDWITGLPWAHDSRDNVSLQQAEKILDREHAGLRKPKERILEFIAAKKFNPDLKRSPILCLVGPAGVGKTSLARSIAASLGREFVRISLGGVRDEAEIRGHRRTYIGALPGKIIQAMRKAGVSNPVILLDEIDKLSNDVHGDPAAALLEVLDPEQNKAFVDHFLDVEYDLSKVTFIATANMIDTIPYPLFDRMEIISLSGYSDEEKITIARKFLVPKVVKEHGLKATQFKIPEESLRYIITYYTKEPGVRQLERLVSKLVRKTIQEFLKDETLKSVTITEARIKAWLGNIKYKKNALSLDKKIGIATGLAWTELGGELLEIETTNVPGKGNIQLTGQLGDVMQESAQAALSYIRTRATELGIQPSFNSSRDLHIHMPEGGTPKDGPSAGITICTALVSSLTKNPVKPSIAMTGEITLQGRVLAIGGLKEKLLAARQHDIKTVMIPKENSDDLDELRKEMDLSSLDIVIVNTMDEVLRTALTKTPFPKRRITKKRVAKTKK